MRNICWDLNWNDNSLSDDQAFTANGKFELIFGREKAKSLCSLHYRSNFASYIGLRWSRNQRSDQFNSCWNWRNKPWNLNITQGKGFYQDFYYVKFIPSADRFRIKLTGFDTAGAKFQRVKPTLFTLGDVKLSQNVHSSNSSNAIFPGGSLELEISVANTGDFQQLYFNASDDLNFFRSINPSQRSLGENDSLLLRVSLAAPSDAKYGVTSTVTVFVSQDSGFTQLVNFMVLFVTVASKVSETEEKVSKL